MIGCYNLVCDLPNLSSLNNHVTLGLFILAGLIMRVTRFSFREGDFFGLTGCSFNALFSRTLNRLKYRFGLDSGSAKFIFSGLPPVQVFPRLILQV